MRNKSKASKWASKDVSWFSVKYKQPVAYSTVADSDAISLINTPNQTAANLMNILKSGRYLVSDDMVKVVQAYIDKGLSDEVIQTEGPRPRKLQKRK